jgi:hypothetical protein
LGDDFEFDDNFMPMYFKDVLINCWYKMILY